MLPRARKRFGQHFLTDTHYLGRIVSAIDPKPSDSMVEIGPGTGILTAPLASVVEKLHVVEIDRDLARDLAAKNFPVGSVVVHEGDALDFDFTTLPSSLRVVGNRPYNVSTPILFRMSEIADRVKDCVFMLQREVVDRMVADPDTADYGRLSVMLQYRFAMERLVKVPPGAFTPPPKVDSAVVRMVPLGRRSIARQATRRSSLASSVAAFSQRRKTLRNSARRPRDRIGVRGSRDRSAQRRGETLSVAEFVALADAALAVR